MKDLTPATSDLLYRSLMCQYTDDVDTPPDTIYRLSCFFYRYREHIFGYKDHAVASFVIFLYFFFFPLVCIYTVNRMFLKGEFRLNPK